MSDYRRGLARGFLTGQLVMLGCFAIGMVISEHMREHREPSTARRWQYAEIWPANSSAPPCTLTIKAYGPDTLYVRTLPAGRWVPIHE